MLAVLPRLHRDLSTWFDSHTAALFWSWDYQGQVDHNSVYPVLAHSLHSARTLCSDHEIAMGTCGAGFVPIFLCVNHSAISGIVYCEISQRVLQGIWSHKPWWQSAYPVITGIQLVIPRPLGELTAEARVSARSLTDQDSFSLPGVCLLFSNTANRHGNCGQGNSTTF